jgi:hypothetical protein
MDLLGLGQIERFRMRTSIHVSARTHSLVFSIGLILMPVIAWSQGTYSTNFPLAENPISEGGRWINGGTTGLNWTNVRTTSGFAYGTQSGSGGYDDATAVLTGSWGPNQTAQATVAVKSASGSSGVFEEVELRLRTTITANSITGYEINCSISTNSNYVQIVRWNGPLGSFTELDGRAYHCVNGDVLKATISGSTITAYLNGTSLFSVTDSTFSTGSPGIGFYLQGTSGVNANYGFSSFTATDGTTTQQNFTLSATPSSQTVTPGTNAAYTVTVAPSGGFTGTVALTASGLPTGAAASFNPSSITTSGSSTLTVSTASTTPSASSPLTITGTSGGVTQTASATLVVSSSGGGSTSGGGLTACDVNKDGTANVVDVQVATNNYLSCSAAPFQSFVSQVITGVLGTCSVNTGLHTVALSWVASTTSGVTYNVYRATTSGGYNYATPLNSTPISGTSFTDCTASLGQTYYYVIRAVDASGNQSANSSETTVTVPSS